MKHKRDDGAEKQEDETVDVTPVMIGVFVVMCCSMLVLLYYFYDQLGTDWGRRSLQPLPLGISGVYFGSVSAGGGRLGFFGQNTHLSRSPRG